MLRFTRPIETGESEERRRPMTERGGDGSDAGIDFVDRPVAVKPAERMVLGMRSDGVAGSSDEPCGLRMRAGLTPDHEECCAHALVGQRLENTAGGRPGR